MGISFGESTRFYFVITTNGTDLTSAETKPLILDFSIYWEEPAFIFCFLRSEQPDTHARVPSAMF
jgi:hypothetical protein